MDKKYKIPQKRWCLITNWFYIYSQISNVDHAINVHEDIACILDRHINTDALKTPKLEKISVQTKCTTCNIEIYTRVEEERVVEECSWCSRTWSNCHEHATYPNDCTSFIFTMFLCCCIQCCCCLVEILYSLLKSSKVYRHFCPACNALVGEYNPKRRAAWMFFWFFYHLCVLMWYSFYIRWLTSEYCVLRIFSLMHIRLWK